MNKKHSIILLSLLQALSIFSLVYYNVTQFSIGFDAADNFWSFSRYYFAVYPHKIIFLFITFMCLLISVFLKNILYQSKGRTMMILISYNIKLIIGLSLVAAISSMNTLLRINDFRAYISMSLLITCFSLSLVVLVGIVLFREVLSKYLYSNKNIS